MAGNVDKEIEKRLEKIKNPYDRLFFEIYTDKDNAIDLITAALPKELLDRIDINSLRLDSNSYIKKELEKRYSDLVYEVNYKSIVIETSIKICLLFEHKSSQPECPELQIEGYKLCIWNSDLKQKKNFHVVSPLIVSHCRDGWKAKPFHEYFGDVEADEYLMSLIYSRSYQLIDLSEKTDDEIRNTMFMKEASKVLALLFKYMNLSREDAKLYLEYLHNILNIMKEHLDLGKEAPRYVIAVLYFILGSTELPKDKLLNVINEVSKEGGKYAMTALEVSKKEGRIEGKLEDAKRMLAEELDIELISRVTELSIEEIKKLQEDK